MAATKCQESVQKNGNVEKKSTPEDKPQEIDCENPFSMLFAVFEKKIRNLEKKRKKVYNLKVLMDGGHKLNQDQLETVQSLKEIDSNIELLRELNKLVDDVKSEHSKKKSIPAKVATALSAGKNNVNPNSIKLEMHKYIMETQNSFKKLVENLEGIKSLKSNDQVLKPEEVEKLLCFWKLIKPSDSVDSTARIKKVIQIYIFLSNKDQRNVNDEIGVSFAQIHTWLKKVNTCLKYVQSQGTGKKEENSVSKVEEKKMEQPIKMVEKSVPKELDNKEVTEASDGWIEIKTSTSSSKKRESTKPQGGERVVNQNLNKKLTNGNNGVSLNGVEDVKTSIKSTKPQIVITDLPAENITKSGFKEQRYYGKYPNNNRGFNRKFRENQPAVTEST